MHIATHNEVDNSQLPYVCNVCNKRFATSQLLLTHGFMHRTKDCINYKTLKTESIIEKSQNKVNNL